MTVLSPERIEGKTPTLEHQADGLWALSLGTLLLARSKLRNELLDWALFVQGAKGVMTVPNPKWDRHEDDT